MLVVMRAVCCRGLLLLPKKFGKQMVGFVLLIAALWTFPSSSLSSPRSARPRDSNNLSRRSFALVQGSGAVSSVVVGSLLWSLPDIAHAKNLPGVTVTDFSKVGTIDALLPIVQLRFALLDLKSDLTMRSNRTTVLSRPLNANLPLDESSLKALFDAYSDPISYKQRFLDQNAFLVYYTKGFDGIGRPSIESDLPLKQTQQYGFRNEAWNAWDEFLSEWSYVRKMNAEEEFQAENLLEPLTRTIAAIDEYLDLAPESDVSDCRRRLSLRVEPPTDDLTTTIL